LGSIVKGRAHSGAFTMNAKSLFNRKKKKATKAMEKKENPSRACKPAQAPDEASISNLERSRGKEGRNGTQLRGDGNQKLPVGNEEGRGATWLSKRKKRWMGKKNKALT